MPKVQIYECWTKLLAFLRLLKEEAEGVVNHQPAPHQCGQSMCCTFQPQQIATISGHPLKNCPVLHCIISYYIVNTFCPSWGLWGGRETSVKRPTAPSWDSSPVTVWPKYALKVACWALRVFFLWFKYPQSKLLKISLGSPKAGCTTNLWL